MPIPSSPALRLFGPCLSVVLGSMGISIAAVALPTLEQHFQGAQWDSSLVVSAYILMITAAIVPVGRAGDVYGKRLVLLSGVLIFAAGAAVATLAPSLPVLILARGVQGLGAAAMLSMPLAQVRDIMGDQGVGRWMGTMGAMSAIGTAMGPTLGGALLAQFGWQMVFLLQVPLAVLTLVLTAIWTPKSAGHGHKAGFDLLGAAVLALLMVMLVVLVSDFGEAVANLKPALLGVPLLLSAIFVYVERRSINPVVDLKWFTSRRITASLIMNALVSMIMIGMLVVGPFFLTLGHGLSTAEMGAVMAVGPVSSAFYGRIAGQLTDHLKPDLSLLFGSLSMVVGALLMLVLPKVAGLWGFVIAFLVLAPGYQQFLAAANTAVMQLVPAEDRGRASGLLNLSRNLGFMLGGALMGAAFRLAMGQPDFTTVPAALVQHGFAVTFALASGLAALAFVIGRWAFRTRSDGAAVSGA